MTTSTTSANTLVRVIDPLEDKILRLAVAAHLARYKGESRTHVASDLNAYLRWCAQMNLPPLEARKFKLSTISR